jgi:phosphoribosylglycinamide formyltransferase 1
VLNLAVLISGAGTTLDNLISRIADGRLPGVRIAGVISSRSTVAGVEIARRAHLPVQIVRRREFPDEAAHSEALTAAVRRLNPDLVVLAGFLCRWLLPPEFEGRTLNIHPALLPKYGGRGMYGRHVHEAVLRAGDTESGCSVHLVDREYDHGRVIAQSRVAVMQGDTPDSLAQRVHAAERELLPSVLARAAAEGVVAAFSPRRD